MTVTRPGRPPPPARLPGALAWLRPLRVASAGWLDEESWRLLVGFAGTLAELLGRSPDDPDATQAARSARMLDLKRLLAAHGYGALDLPAPATGSHRLGRLAAAHAPDPRATAGPRAELRLQPLVQFICGYHDLDLRDAATIGHGRLLARHGTNAQHATWLPRLRAGALCGIAMTEPHGGTQLQATTTSLTPASGSRSGRLRLDGEKCYVSRLLEADVFVVVCRHAAAIHAGLLACLAAVGLAAAGDPAAATWGLLVKANGVDTACHAAAEVGLLAGALGYQANHRIDKTRRDLDGLRYADGIHEELYRAAGRAILTDTRANLRAHPATGLAAPTIDDRIATEP